MEGSAGGKAAADDFNPVLLRAAERRFGVVALRFLRRSVTELRPAAPFCLPQRASLAEAIGGLRERRIGCVLVTDDAGRLSGILSERDCILKVYGLGVDAARERVEGFMTPRPQTGTAEMTIAHALNLMSHGGFRHIPLVDADRRPAGIISVKNIVDSLTREFLAEMEAGPGK